MILDNSYIEKSFNVYDNIYNFLKKLKFKYKVPISKDILIKLDEQDKNDIYEISIEIINKVLNISLQEENTNENPPRSNDENKNGNELNEEFTYESEFSENENLGQDNKIKDNDDNEILEGKYNYI